MLDMYHTTQGSGSCSAMCLQRGQAQSSNLQSWRESMFGGGGLRAVVWVTPGQLTAKGFCSAWKCQLRPLTCNMIMSTTDNVEYGTKSCLLGLQMEPKAKQGTTRDLKQVAVDAPSFYTGGASACKKWVTHSMIKIACMHPDSKVICDRCSQVLCGVLVMALLTHLTAVNCVHHAVDVHSFTCCDTNRNMTL